ncbi:hypothetical protein F0357_21465 [Rhizobiales bacterium Sp-1]|uniref:Beta-ketoacyl synthase-like N-terminal domain-containing protein n=1 Tax=Segnochrobactrum spirostomi TaxID=2608987 RepID=A0A6A7YCR4_9HYPH|nr:hypothetical protein [Segnochrobactrum spirostomi]
MTAARGSVVFDAAIVGAACRLPQADSLDAFWGVLREGRNVVTERPSGRWSVERFLRPGPPSPALPTRLPGVT